MFSAAKIWEVDAEIIKTLAVLTLGAAACLVLHLFIRSGQSQLERRFSRTGGYGTEVTPSFKLLLIEWLGHGLQTAAWTLYVALVLTLLPRTRVQVETVGVKLRRQFLYLVDWLGDRGFNLILILIVTVFLMRFVDALTRTIFILIKRTAGQEEAATQRRLGTLSSIFSGGAQSLILFVGLMVLLQQLSVNITPILASAGVIGIAVGFGAQSLIRDLFSGFLVLLEDQFSVGDVVKIGEITGAVEQITLRATRIRSLDGSLTVIPNGAISIVSNHSKDWSRIVIDLEVDHNENIDRAMQIALATAAEFRRDLPREVIEEPTMLGVEKISLTSVAIRLVARTVPARQFDLARELRRRLLIAFQANGIRMPVPVSQLLLADSISPYPQPSGVADASNQDNGQSGSNL